MTTLREVSEILDGFVYRVPGPAGSDSRWIARSVHGHVAYGRTPESAAENLAAGLTALAQAAGQPLPSPRQDSGRRADQP
jgi:hypothetical protein